jgi:CO/xanthine dehydrogenase Mo-binding subunit
MSDHDEQRERKTATRWQRRTFLKTSGAVVVGIGVAAVPGSVQAGQARTGPYVRGVVSGPPDDAELDAYIAIHPNNTITIFSGHVDHGAGGPTTLRQVAADELDLDFSQVSIARNDTFVSTAGNTGASRTAATGGAKLRAASAEARRVLMTLASERLGVPAQELSVAKGVVFVRSDPRRSVTYGDLMGDRAFNRRYEPVTYDGGIELPRRGRNNAPQKSPADYTIVGARVPRMDTLAKVKGTLVFMQHVRVPGMLHGRVVWPRGQRAYGSAPKVMSIDEKSIANLPGVRIVRRGNFVGVVAEREWDAVRASRQLAVTWDTPPELPGSEGLFAKIRAAKTEDETVVNTGDMAVLTKAAHSASATYRAPYQAHAAFAPNCAIADVTRDSALVMCSAQNLPIIRDPISLIIGLPVEKIRVQYFEGSNTFGPTCYKDAAQAAAIMSQEVGKPIRVQLSRQDETGWENYGPAHLADVRGAVDADGKLVAFDYQGWGHGTATLITIEQQAIGSLPTVNDGGTLRLRLSQNDMYDVANRRMIDHRLPGLEGYLRAGPLRAPLDPPYFFAQELMMDELAHLARLDPLAFRLRNISHPRWRGVLEAAATAAKWTPRVAASTLSDAKIALGRGIGLGTHHVPRNQGNRITFAAAVVEIEVNKETGTILAKHVYGAMDCGLAINPIIVEQQIIGMSVHGVSLALKEEVRFNKSNVTSLDWASYPILRFKDSPRVTPIVVQRINEQVSGAGEEVLPAVVAAMGNAFFDATGVWLREFPMTPARVLAALKTTEGSRPSA